MARKNYWYVMVFTMGGPVCVTSTGTHHTVFWDASKKPRVYGRYLAEEIAGGLRLNGTSACAVVYPFELDHQPYNYDHFDLVIKKKEEQDGNEK